MGRGKTKKSKSKYFGVSSNETTTRGATSFQRLREKYPWRAVVIISGSTIVSKSFETELEAAKAVDMALIRNGLQPRNILKPKP